MPRPRASPLVQPASAPWRSVVSTMLPGISRKGVVIDASPRPAFSHAVSARERVPGGGIGGRGFGSIAYGGVAGPGPEPTPIGHEFSAVVERVGSDVKRYRPGARVVVNPLAGNSMIGNGGELGAFGPELIV